jgi:hypothetical protein
MFESVFEWRHSKLLPEDIDEVFCGHETYVRSQLTHIDVGAFQ